MARLGHLGVSGGEHQGAFKANSAISKLRLYDIPDGKFVLRNDLIEQNTVVVGKTTFHFDNEAEANLLYEAVSVFGPGQYLLPDNEADARQALAEWLEHKAELNAWFRKRSEECSDDEDYIARMIKQFWVLYRDYRRGLKNPPASLKSPVRKIHVEPSADGEPSPIVFDGVPRGRKVAPETEVTLQPA